MISPSYSTSIRVVCVASILLATLLASPDANAQRTRRYGKSPTNAIATPARQAQFESPEIPSVDLPIPSYEAESVLAPSEVAVPSYDTPVMNAPDGMMHADPAYPMNEVPMNEVPLNEIPHYENETLVDAYEQGSQYAADDSAAPIYSTGTWFWRGDWYAQADITWLTRNVPTEVFVAQDVTIPPTVNNTSGAFYRLDDIVDHDFAPGTRLTLGRFLGRDAANRDYALDFTFLGGFSWDDSNTLISRDNNGLNTLFNSSSDFGDLTQAFFGSDAQTIRYEADLNSYELNYRIRTRPGRDQLAMQPDGRWVRHGVGSQIRSLLGGVRFLSFSEALRYTTTAAGSESSAVTTRISDGGQSTVNSAAIDDLVRGRYTVRTDNDMLGLQLGGELIEKSDDWTWGVRAKAGGLVNFAGRQSLINSLLRDQSVTTTMTPAVDVDGFAVFEDVARDPNGDPILTNGNTTTVFVADRDGNDVTGLTRAMDTVVTTSQDPDVQLMGDGRDAEKLTFLAELGLFGTYQIRPNFHFKAAYDFMLLAGVGLAPKNTNLTNGFGVFNVGSSVFLHGGSFGFETTW